MIANHTLKFTTVLLFIVFLALNACKKDKENNSNQPSSAQKIRIEKQTSISHYYYSDSNSTNEYKDSTTLIYSYNTEGNLSYITNIFATFKLIYCSTNQLNKIEVYFLGGLVGYLDVEMNESNKLKKLTLYGGISNLGALHQMIFIKQGVSQRNQSSDEFEWSETHTLTYSSDLLKEVALVRAEDSSITYLSKYTYDSNKNPIFIDYYEDQTFTGKQELKYDSNLNTLALAGTFEYIFSGMFSKNSLIERKFTSDNDTIVDIFNNIYDSDGYLISTSTLRDNTTETTRFKLAKQ
jgi:hypothetical protein